jgi:hypothetical protein
MDEMMNINKLRLSGAICILVSWGLLFSSSILSFDLDTIFRNQLYYLIYISGFVGACVGCFFLSFCSHKKIINKDKKESCSSICFLILENTSVLCGIILLELDIIFWLTNNSPSKYMDIAHILVCSLIFVLSGLFGLCNRRMFTNISTIISLCFIALAILDLSKTLSIS